MNRTLGVLTAVLVLAAGSVHAQAPDDPSAQEVSTRTATTTTLGDTGFWFVPTAEILPDRRWSASLFRSNIDREPGITDISHIGVSFGVGLRDRAELFGVVHVNTRVARRIRGPLFQPDNIAGGPAVEVPGLREGWSGNNFGDIFLGAKVSLLSQHLGSPASVALRGVVKLPSASRDDGAGTGATDLMVDAIVSGEVNETVELSGFGGLLYRGNPSNFDLPSAFRWGFGVAAPTRQPVRFHVELMGEQRFDGSIALDSPITAIDGSVSPLTSNVRNPIDGSVGLVWRLDSGFFVDASMSFNLVHRGRTDVGLPSKFGDRMGRQIRLGYHPGTAVFVPPAPEPPPPPPIRPPTVKARCEPCTVQVGRSSTVTADATHPDGLPLTYRWSAPAGTFANPTDRQTLWTAPEQEGAVPITVTVEDGRGGTASDTVTIQVVRPPVREFTFEDVHFDFDRHSLRADATRLLDEAVKTLLENRELNIEIEGHTCSIGTAEYNLALGERRAVSVRDYLVSRGVGAERLRTVSYGEERPKHDNAREETRRLNRRAALVVRIQ